MELTVNDKHIEVIPTFCEVTNGKQSGIIRVKLTMVTATFLSEYERECLERSIREKLKEV